MPDLTLRLQASHFTSNDPDNPQGWQLVITDDLSNTRVVDAQLSPEQFYNLMRGGNVEITGWVTTPEQFDRVGKKMRHWSQMVPREYEPAYNEPNTKALAWAEANSSELFDTIEIRRQNNGTKAIYRAWEEV